MRRGSASAFCTILGPILGKIPYFYQRSRADERCNRLGSRIFFWAKDLNASFTPERVPSNALRCLVDVDYYVDMPEYLARNVSPVVLYTLCPDQASKSTGDYTYCFTPDNEIRYSVSGGATYKHPLWDYSGDTLVAEKYYLWGLICRSTSYYIERRSVNADHQLVCLIPKATLLMPFISLSWFVSHDPLTRFEPVVRHGDDDFVRFYIQTREGRKVTTGVCNEYACATIPVAIDSSLTNHVKTSSTNITNAYVKIATGDDDNVASTTLVRYHRQATVKPHPVVFTLKESINLFGFSVHEDEKPAMTPFMSALTNGCFIPNVGKSCDDQSVKGRITDVRNPNEPTVSGPMIKYQAEFLEFLIPEPHRLIPVEEEDVFARQPRPSQQAILNRAAALGGLDKDTPVVSFMKREAYAKVTDPRNISTIPDRNKLAYSKYTYAFSTILRKQKWYAFAKTPLEIAQRVAEICMAALSHVIKTDLARCDGRIGHVFRDFEKAAMLRAFALEYHDELLEVMSTQKQQRGRTATGGGYETGDTRLSGSPETAEFNTLDNALMAYVTFRKAGYSPAEAWAKLGIYGGDDGLTPDAPKRLYETVGETTVRSSKLKPLTSMNQESISSLDCTVPMYG